MGNCTPIQKFLFDKNVLLLYGYVETYLVTSGDGGQVGYVQGSLHVWSARVRIPTSPVPLGVTLPVGFAPLDSVWSVDAFNQLV